MTGKFITVEGTDGAGKSTQIELMVNYIKEKGYDVVLTREPGGTKIGERIRDIILDINSKEMDSTTETLLYAASRAQHIYEKIIPALNKGKIVICDRFLDSSLVYQGFARGVDIDSIKIINKLSVGGITPDVTIFLDLNPSVGIKRKKDGRNLDRIEAEEMDFHLKVYNGYKILLNENKDRIKSVDASLSITAIHYEIQRIVGRILE